MGVMGYYNIISMLLNLDRYPLPEGVKPVERASACNGRFSVRAGGG